MPITKLARFAVRADARDAAERAMHELASHVRDKLPDASWTAYRDPRAPTHYVALIHADDAEADAKQHAAFTAALAPHLAGDLDIVHCELVTSSDLARRHRRR